MATYPTLLNYTFAPEPLTTGATQELTIIGSLKPGTPSVEMNAISFNFGTAGPAANNLTSKITQLSSLTITTSDPSWEVQDKDSGLLLTIEPMEDSNGVRNPITIHQGEAIVISIPGFKVNEVEGNTTLTIKETPATSPYPPGSHIEEQLILTKVDSALASEVTFSANQPEIKAKDATSLTWNVSHTPGTISLHYIKQGQKHTITTQADKNGQQKPLSTSGTYPGTYDHDLALTISETTTFVLEVKPGQGASTYATTTVIVSEPEIYAQDATIADDISTDTLTLTNHSGTWTIQNQANNSLYIQHSKGAQLSLSPTGELTVNGGINVQGNATITGTLTVSELLTASKGLTASETSHFEKDIVVGGGSYVKSRGGRTYIGSLGPENNWKVADLFNSSSNTYKCFYNYYEFIFNSIVPEKNHSQDFGARFIYSRQTTGDNSSEYSTILYGNDRIANNCQSYDNNNYLRLWSGDRRGPNDSNGIVGTMTLYKWSTVGVIAHIFAPKTYDSKNGCQVWVEGNQNTNKKTAHLWGIEFDFYDGQGIKSGYIDVYGWN